MSNITDLLSQASGAITPLERCIKRWQDMKLESVDDYHLALENFKIVFTYNSNAVEDINVSYHTTREIYEDKSITFNGNPRDLFAVTNQSNTFDVMLRDLAQGKTLVIDRVKEYHGMLLAGCYDKVRWNKGERPGELKHNDYCVGLTNEGSTPDEVETDLLILLAEVNNAGCVSVEDKLKTVAYFHLKFEQIHPFADGNGRMGRNLINYLLIQMGLPPIVIYNEDKDTYYMALEVFDRTGELDGFVKFLKEQMIKTWERHK